jgi:tetratricopeptide (TPR) repeat protein
VGTYKLRIYNWSESAKRYADLSNGAMVVQVYNEIKTLRAADALTATATWVYVPSLVESLYRVGETDIALALANTIPSGSTYLGSAFKLVAIYEALQGNLQGALTIADNVTYFPKDEDKLDVLTYYASNHNNPGIALALLNAGPERFSDARRALEKAEELLEGMTQSSNLARIRYGYVKVAELYAQIGDPAKAAALLQRAQALIIDDVYAVAAMIDIALGYHNINQTSVALLLLASAQDQADANPTWYRTDAITNLTPEEVATLLYESFVKAYEKVGAKDRVHTTTVNFFLPWAQQIHPAGVVSDTLAGKECDYLLHAALYMENAGEHDAALNALSAAKESSDQIVIVATRLKKYLTVVAAYAAAHEYAQALTLATALPLTTERNQAIQALANAHIDRNDFPESLVASIDSDSDGQPDFFHPLASAEEIAASGLILDADSDGDGIADTLDLRPLFAD